MKPKAPWIFVLLGAALATAAVSNGQKEYPVATTITDGVKTVTNPDYPRDGRFEAGLTEEMSCGEEARPEAATLNKPLDIKVDNQGRVYVLDWGDVHIKVFDKDGRFLRTISRKGQGPGEFDMPAFFGLLTDGRVCLLDGRQRRISLFSNDGQYVSGFPLDGFFRAVAVDAQNRLYLAKWGQKGEPKLSAEFREVPYVTSIYRLDAPGKKMVLLTDMLGESMIMKAAGESVVMAGGLYTIVWNIDRKGKLYGGYNETYSLNAYGPEGKIEFTFGREYDFIKNPRYSGQVGQKKNLPAYTRTIVFDEDGALWIELTKSAEATGFTYDVFSPEGIYLKQVKIAHRISQFENGRIYCLVQPEDGFPSIKRFRMELLSAK